MKSPDEMHLDNSLEKVGKPKWILYLERIRASNIFNRQCHLVVKTEVTNKLLRRKMETSLRKILEKPEYV